MIIDCHGHYTTAPEPHTEWREEQLAAALVGLDPPLYPAISDDEIRETLEASQLRLIRERGTDLTLFSPRASAMAHHLGDPKTSQQWAQVNNDLIRRVVGLYPDVYLGCCQLPQFPGEPISSSIPELERAVTELGFVGVILNPDPSGGYWTAPALTDESWFPIYEKLVELDVPAMVHPSSSANPVFHGTGDHYLNVDTTAFMQLLRGDLFAEFPTLRLVIPHGGGAVPYHWGRYRGLADMLHQPALDGHVMRNVFFDTCVYHQAGIDLLLDVIDTENIIFGSEMVGAVRGIDPTTGNYFDDTRRYIDAAAISEADRELIYSGNVRRVLPRVDVHLSAKGPLTVAAFTMDPDWICFDPDPTEPTFVLPPGTVDAHCHVFGPGDIFPFAPERKYTPCDAGKDALFALRDFLGVDRNVVVQATCHGTDNRAMVDALRASEGRARGIATVDENVSDDELSELAQAGVRGVRFNFVKRLVDPGPDATYHRIAERIAPLGWHIVVYFEAPDLEERWSLFTSLPTAIVVDHMGRPDPRKPLDGPEFQRFVQLMDENPSVWSKVTCPERLSFSGPPGYDDVVPFARYLVERFPSRVLWGTDWPHPNMTDHMPDDGKTVDFIPRIAPTPELREKLLVENPTRLYWG